MKKTKRKVGVILILVAQVAIIAGMVYLWDFTRKRIFLVPVQVPCSQEETHEPSEFAPGLAPNELLA